MFNNPEMMKMASEMMAKMTPEQMAQMQRQMASMPPEFMQQAMNTAQNATPEQLRQMRSAAAGMSGDDLASQAAAGLGQQSAQLKYQLDAAAQLKAEGNRLHGARQYREAAEKYERAASNLRDHTSQQARELRASCQSNLASCFLQLERWQECVDVCDAVLAADGSNRKALYRRGQALCALGRYDGAVADLSHALQLSPDSEKGVIGEKLDEVEQRRRHTSRGVVIEEVTEPAAVGERAAAPASVTHPQEGLAESDGDEDVPPLQPEPAAATASVAARGAGGMPFGVPGLDAERMQQTAEMLQNNPDMARQAAEAMAAMSDAQIASLAAQSGMPGISPEMAKQAAAAMRTMPAEQLSAMAQQARAAAAGGGAALPAPPPAAAPAAATAAVPGGGGDQMAAAAAAMRQNPDMMKQAAAMMEGMSEADLASMAAMMPGSAGMQVDPAQMKMAAKMMAGMSAEDVERMTRMAASMGMTPGGAGAGSAAAAASGGGGGAGAGPAAGPAGAGLPPGLDPANMADMRKRLQDPEMLKMMKGMMQGMDPASLADMMKASGVNVTPEQARSIVNQLDRVSDKHLEVLARIMGYASAVAAAYRRAKAWVFSQGALAVAALVLVVALLLKWLGWL